MRLARLAGALAAAALASAACDPGGPAPEPGAIAPAADPWVERTAPGELRLDWPAAWTRGAVAVRGGPDPDALTAGTALGTADHAPLAFADPAPGRRSYFLLERADGPPLVVAERRLPLEGAANFRDLGGWSTGDGRRVAWGRLYRSEDLSALEDGDLAYLRGIGLRLVCDLRSAEERADAPDRLPDPAPEVAALPIEDAQLGAGRIRDRLLGGALSQAEAERLLQDGNVAFATRFRGRYAALFERLLAEDALPALVHCTAGKDRAGFAAALVLLALGVSEDQVMDDYLATNTYTAETTRRRLRMIQLVSLFRTSSAEARPLLEARRGYLEAALGAMRAGWGDVDTYLEHALGLGPEQRARLRERLLAKALR
jgi:protein-tyrosine phosphatase